MPTGYTAAIKDGISFNDFVMQCARAMGALVMMRDEPSDAPIPERFEPSDYNAKRLAEAEALVAKMHDAANTDKLKPEFEKEKAEEIAKAEKYMREKVELRGKYKAMLAKVKTWQPPTPDHQGFKDFMVEQITGSIDFDCGGKWAEEELERWTKMDYLTWHNDKLQKAYRDVKYHTEAHQDEVERTEGRNAWVKALRDSLANDQ